MKVISLFSGAMGLDLGLEAAGHQVVVAVENDQTAVATIRLNRPNLAVIARPIEEISTAEILSAAGLRPGDDFILVGGPCCQAFSTVGKRASLGDPRGNLFLEFVRVVRQARPKFFLMENVRGLLSAAIRHRPLKTRGPGHPALKSDELLGSAFTKVVLELRKLGYYTVFDVLNAANFGTPQKRERFIAMGARDGHILSMPTPTHAEVPSGRLKPWKTLRNALKARKSIGPPIYMPLTPTQKRFLPLVPAGGDWRDLPTQLRREAMGKALDSWGGRTGFLRRLAWDRPAPSLVTSPAARATCLAHPDEDRPLSLWEYARVQEFPADWKFAGSVGATYRQIGNAVPVGLGRALGLALEAALRSRRRTDLRGVFCANQKLLDSIARRPTTLLNPPRQRGGNKQTVEQWKAGMPTMRDTVLAKVNVPIRARTKPHHHAGKSPARNRVAVRPRAKSAALATKARTRSL